MNVTGPAHDGGNAVPLRTKDVRLRLTAVCAIAWKASIKADATQVWYSKGWPHNAVVDWSAIPDSVSATPSIDLYQLAAQNTDATHTTYLLSIANVPNSPQPFEVRVCLL